MVHYNSEVFHSGENWHVPYMRTGLVATSENTNTGFEIKRSFVSNESQRITHALHTELALMSEFAFEFQPRSFLKTVMKGENDYPSIAIFIPSGLPDPFNLDADIRK